MKGYSGDPNEDFNIRSCRPGQGVISPPGASHHCEEKTGRERWVNTDGDSCRYFGELLFHSLSAADCATKRRATYSIT